VNTTKQQLTPKPFARAIVRPVLVHMSEVSEACRIGSGPGSCAASNEAGSTEYDVPSLAVARDWAGGYGGRVDGAWATALRFRTCAVSGHGCCLQSPFASLQARSVSSLPQYLCVRRDSFVRVFCISQRLFETLLSLRYMPPSLLPRFWSNA
jgi:hypothetical protein